MEKGDLSARIDAKIKEKTGLHTEKEVQAYYFFCSNADYDGMCKGMILDGNVKREFYALVKERILKKEGIKTLDSLDKKRKEKIEGRIEGESWRKYNSWYNFFKEKDLISEPRKPNPKCHYEVPMLLGYNPFNDTEFYIPYKSKGQAEFMGRVSRDFLTPEEKEKREKLGEVFKI